MQTVSLNKQDWLLLFLYYKPLDTIRLSNAIFLLWNRIGRNLNSYFEFTPCIYGPYSVDVYAELRNLENKHLICKNLVSITEHTPYYLTTLGFSKIPLIQSTIDKHITCMMRDIAYEVSSKKYGDIQRIIYSEAPDFMDCPREHI